MYSQLYSWDNLLLAFHKASKGKRGHAAVAAFEYRLEDNLLQLQHELKGQIYKPGEYHSFYIHDPKKRLISAAPFRDRVVHHALCNLIEPIFERSFIFDSYANRIGKGTHKAIDRAQKFSRRFQYVLTCDVRQFFPSIDHAVLREILAQKIEDHQVMRLVDGILASGVGVLSDEYEMAYFPDDDPSTGSGQGLFAKLRPRGLPIGNLTSQFWANCYLNPFDHFVKRRLQCKGYVRYVDDFLLFSNHKAELNKWREQIIAELCKYRLTLHETKCQAQPATEGIPFLGFHIFPEHRRLKRRKGVAFQRKFKLARKAFHRDELTFTDLNSIAFGWVNHVRRANTYRLRRSVFASTMT